ncbi:hypothetical protein DEJ28_17915 [Curtobacterium sp. MCPF17_002]|uniref:hypothetical protein n=1 Tax=Curtobacterium sp. MCPF17_002 TaxID=2175645 RepID=UPI000DA95CD8|nr:hypothetical protein [Curtobacterium sp. MCPF17_002]WIB77496.1 hypothetical protein DEJ28_17915 [Curtobacterium sp. MCPF17_002]
MSVVNFAVAILVPRLLRRVSAAQVMLAGVILTAAGMWWLAQVQADSSFLLGVALPMVVIGAGQGLTFAPLTGFGLDGAIASDAGAASGLVNTAHQLGSSLGLAVLVAISTAAAGGTGVAAVVTRTDAALTAATVLLVAGAVLAAVGTVRRRTTH